MTEDKKLAKATYSYQPSPFILPGQSTVYIESQGTSYHDVIRQCRHYYEHDTIAGTVVNRMVDIANTTIKNKHRKGTQETRAYFDAVARLLTPMIKQIPLTYMLDGMAIPEYRTERVLGNRIDDRLGRTRYVIPKAIWVRDAANIIIKKSPLGGRILYLKITSEDKRLIEDRGKPDRIQEYEELVQLYPDYVAAVQNGETVFRLHSSAIFRKLAAHNEYPIPFLKNSLDALAYRKRLKQMDRITSDRVINALRHISVGDKDYPADDDDIKATKAAIEAQTNQETLLNVYTNHTVKIQWIIPDMNHLLDERKYSEANGDVFMGMGFPRLWAVGENEKSNTSDNKLASVGPISTLDDMRKDIIVWIKGVYAELANANGFLTYPEPYFSPISQADAKDLLQYAALFVEDGVISRDTAAQIFGTTYEEESEQIKKEQSNVRTIDNNNANNTEIQKPDQVT
jgi:hypothetical protein